MTEPIETHKYRTRWQPPRQRDISVLLIVDPEEPLLTTVRTAEPTTLRHNVLTLARAAPVLGIALIVTMASEEATDDVLWKELSTLGSEFPVLTRPTFNPFDSDALTRALLELGRSRVVVAGLWTEGCVSHAALAGFRIGYDVEVAVDCVGSVSSDAHRFGLQRLIQAGCVPVRWRQLFFEWQQSWNEGAYSQSAHRSHSRSPGHRWSLPCLPRSP